MSEQNPQGQVALRVRNLSLDFHLRTHVLHAARDVSFDLHSGKTLCLVGESGSGKSVTARALMRLIDPPGKMSAGEIVLSPGTDREIDISALGEHGKDILQIRGSRIALIFQEPMSSLSPVHTIGSQIIEALRLHRKLDKKGARAEAIELLKQVEIPNPDQMIDRYTFEFSGGMRQRAMIAMALACDPEVLIADEPTTALDVTTQAEILDLIKRLQTSRGMAVLLITHDLGVVAEIADEVAVMRYGRIVETGSVDDIFHNPGHAYTKRLLSSTVKLEHSPRVQDDNQFDASPILKVRGLSKVFGETPGWFGRKSYALKAVDDVSFDLHRGENLGIVGESGSGKTTLGRLILRILEPTAGTVAFRPTSDQELDITALSKKEMRKVHRDMRLVFQDPFASLNPRMTVKQIIADPLIVWGDMNGRAIEDKVAELLDLVGLGRDAMERYPHAFSGGQRQRIGIARALALDPKVIIADEATSALDGSIRSQILDLLLDIQSRLALSYIFISHDISVVRYFCDRVAVMHRGKVVELGTAEQICTAPREPYTQKLISAVPNPDPRNKRMLHRSRETV